MPVSFAEQPILNSPYEYPRRHWEMEGGVPTDRLVESRRRAEYIMPVPPASRTAQQAAMVVGAAEYSTAEQEYDRAAVNINLIRDRVNAWRNLPNPNDWGVTPETRRLLQHWRSGDFPNQRPFFCQVEAAETIIYLTEVAGLLPPGGGQPRNNELRDLRGRLAGANADANPELFRLALKLATGAGKTTVMAMLIAWQTVNAVKYPQRRRFTRGFLVVTPGITIRDRLRALLPNDPGNYYETRQLVPRELLPAMQQARVVITNYHALQLRERGELAAGSRQLLQGRTGPELNTQESEMQMLRRVMPELLRMQNALVINDEGHHCYRRRPRAESEERPLEADERQEAEENNEQARVWISGLEAVQRHIGAIGVLDLSATPFFLRGSGYIEGALFPWTVGDFSLMDAIEAGIVKIPRVPVDDNALAEARPVYRELWPRVREALPRAGRRRHSAAPDPLSLPPQLVSALEALYGGYERTFEDWQEAGLESPPVFIVVCQNTAISRLIYEYIAGFERPAGADGREETKFLGRFGLLRNYDENGRRRASPRTLLIDSQQLEESGALPEGFRDAAAADLQDFLRERAQRSGQPSAAGPLSDAEILREMMNTVGQPGRLGAGVRCVVSVSMLTEGWDANTVTHILGVRAFGTQLLCEQVVGRALRRQSYELNEAGLFDVEYAEVLGVPFDFAESSGQPKPAAPATTLRVKAVSPEGDRYEIAFPRVTAYRVELPDERLTARFDESSELALTVGLVGPTDTEIQGIVGQETRLTLAQLRQVRPQQIAFQLTAYILQHHLREPGATDRPHLFGQLKGIVGHWLEHYLKCSPEVFPAQALYPVVADRAAERIKAAIAKAVQAEQPDAPQRLKAVIAPYHPLGYTRYVDFTTTRRPGGRFQREVLETGPESKSHLNRAVCDSRWEAAFCRLLARHPQVTAWVKNHGLGFEVPYMAGDGGPRTYRPDFIALIDDGRGPDDRLRLVAEVKGYRGEDAADKARTMQHYWIPGVNNLGSYGRWAFHEFTSQPDELAGEFEEALGRAAAGGGGP